MNLFRMAGVALATAVAGLASADLLTPIDQERFVKAHASMHDPYVPPYYWYDDDFAQALGFEPFNETVSAATGPGMGVASQISEINTDGISAAGDAWAQGEMFGVMHGSAQGSAESSLSVTFSLDSWTYMELAGSMAYDACLGWAIATLTLQGGGQTVVEHEIYGTECTSGFLDINDELWLEAGEYALQASCFSSECGDEWIPCDSDSEFSFEMNLMLQEPCGADCFPLGGDGVIDVLDLILLLAEWGSTNSPADVAPGPGDGIVDVQDLLLVLGQWGPCE